MSQEAVTSNPINFISNKSLNYNDLLIDKLQKSALTFRKKYQKVRTIDAKKPTAAALQYAVSPCIRSNLQRFLASRDIHNSRASDENPVARSCIGADACA